MLRPNTRLVLLAHASNVGGAVQDAAAVGKICCEHGVPFALDAAQTAGHWEVDFEGWGLSALSFGAEEAVFACVGVKREHGDAG